MVLVVAIVGLLASWSSTGYIDTELATGHTTPAGARLFGALVPLFVAAMLLALLAGNAGGHVGRDRGHHRRDRVPRRSPPQPRVARSVLEVRDHRIGRSSSLAFLGTVVLAYAARAAGATSADALNWDTLTAIGGRSGPGDGMRLAGRSVAPRLRHQGRPRAHAHVAPRRAQPGPRPRLRADVRGAARRRVLGDLAVQDRHRRRAPARATCADCSSSWRSSPSPSPRR